MPRLDTLGDFSYFCKIVLTLETTPLFIMKRLLLMLLLLLPAAATVAQDLRTWEEEFARMGEQEDMESAIQETGATGGPVGTFMRQAN